MNDGFICSDIWGAAALSYAGYPVYRVELLNRSATAWHFDCASEDAKIILDDYNNGRLTLSDARAYSKAFSMLNAQQNDMRRSGRSSWVSADWVAGRVGK